MLIEDGETKYGCSADLIHKLTKSDQVFVLVVDGCHGSGYAFDVATRDDPDKRIELARTLLMVALRVMSDAKDVKRAQRHRVVVEVVPLACPICATPMPDASAYQVNDGTICSACATPLIVVEHQRGLAMRPASRDEIGPEFARVVDEVTAGRGQA